MSRLWTRFARFGQAGLSRHRSNRAVSKSVDSLTGDRGFESPSLLQPVCLTGEFRGCRGSGPKAPAFPAGVPGQPVARSTESRRTRRHRANLGQYLCGAVFQYRIFGDVVATNCWVKVARPVPNRGRTSLWGTGMLVDLARSDRAQAKPSAVR